MEVGYNVILIISAVILGLVCVLIIGAGITMALWYQSQQKKKKDALKVAGVRGEAMVLDYQVTPTDPESNDIAWVRLEMRVPGLAPYILEKRAPLRHAGLLKKGMLVAVWVDKNDPQNSDKVVIAVQRPG